jgi:hypothetical protein
MIAILRQYLLVSNYYSLNYKQNWPLGRACYHRKPLYLPFDHNPKANSSVMHFYFGLKIFVEQMSTIKIRNHFSIIKIYWDLKIISSSFYLFGKNFRKSGVLDIRVKKLCLLIFFWKIVFYKKKLS